MTGFIEVRHPKTNKILFEYDPVRRVVAVLHRRHDPYTGKHIAEVELVELDAIASAPVEAKGLDNNMPSDVE